MTRILHPSRRTVRMAFLVIATAAPAALFAQGTPADYARATTLRERYEGAAIDIAGAPTAIGDTHRFWYRKSVTGGNEFIVIDADSQQKQPAFDHERIAQALSTLTGETYTGVRLPFNTITYSDDGSAFTANVENIYAGPQGSFVPKTFFAYNSMQSQAELASSSSRSTVWGRRIARRPFTMSRG